MARIRRWGLLVKRRISARSSSNRMRPRIVYGTAMAALAICAIAAFGFQGTPPSNRASDLVNKYCVGCHNQKLKTANLTLDNIDTVNIANSAEAWEKVIVKLRSRA